MARWLPVAIHSTIAAVFFFGINRFALGQTLETSLVWGAIAAPFAGYLAYTQSKKL